MNTSTPTYIEELTDPRYSGTHGEDGRVWRLPGDLGRDADAQMASIVQNPVMREFFIRTLEQILNG
jgi:hypothetical protein